MHRPLAVAVAIACWLAAPAGAWAQEGPALDIAGLTGAATEAVAATGAAVETTVTAVAPVTGPAEDTVKQVAGTVGQVTGPNGPVAQVGAGTASAAGSVVEQVTRTAAPVAGVADRVVPGARPLVDETLENAAGAARAAVRDSGTAGAATGQGSPRVERLSTGPPAGTEPPRAARLRLRGAGAPERPATTVPGPPAERAAPAFTPLIPGPAIGLPSTPAGGGDTGASSAPASGAVELPSDTEPASGAAGGSSAAGASVSFALGGLALLLATLSLAGPALRRRLPRRPVMGWPAAFVPLLERPG